MSLRIASLVLGGLVLSVVWLGPLPALAPRAFWAHMTMHMAVVAVAAPLLAWGCSGGRVDPVRRAPAWFPVIVLSFVELIAVWAWHAPALHRLARGSTLGLIAEQGTFLLAGWLVWVAALGGDPAQRMQRAAQSVTALLLTSMHMTLLGALIALTPRPLYASAGAVEFCGAGGLDDLHLGGAIMLLIGGAVYLAGGLGITASVLRARRSAWMGGVS